MNFLNEIIFKDLINSIISLDPDNIKEETQKALDQKIDPIEIIEEGFAKGLKIVGDKYESGEFFLPELIFAAENVKKTIIELLEPLIARKKEKREPIGVVVIGTVKGDEHDIGKNIIASFLYAAGFEVYDLGKDVPAEEFVEKAIEVNADIVGASALLTTTLPEQEEIVNAFKEAGYRDKVKIIFGGATVTQDWVNQIGGDGFSFDPSDTVKLVKTLLNRED